MIFKSLEIYFLSASDKGRWSVTFLVLLLILCGWWRYAFQPLRTKLAAREHMFEWSYAASQENAQRMVMDRINHKALDHRLAFVGDYNHFLKDLLKYDLTTQKIDTETTIALDATRITRLKISFVGTFEKFYEFFAYQQKNYLCSWDSCVCTRSPEGALLCDADIVLYFK